MKQNNLGFKCQVLDDTLNIDIFTEIGEYEDFLGNQQGYGVKKLTEQIQNTTANKINIRMNSTGGNLYQGIAVLNLLKDTKKEITTTIVGIAASAASIISMAGKVKMYPTSQMMIHNCWTVACGNSKELRKVADDMDKAMESAKLSYLEKAKDRLTPEELDLLLDEETYLTATECIELGLCDEIIEEPQAKNTENVLDFKNTNQLIHTKNTIKEEKEPTETHWFFD